MERLAGVCMNVYVQCIITIPFIVISIQVYLWSASLKGAERQRHCRTLGIAYTSLGSACFLFRTLPFAVVGLVLFMLGMRLIAHSLDRIDKKMFIDRYEDEE